MKYIALLIGKILIIIGKIFRRGSSLPGKVALKLDSKLLYQLKYPKQKIIVTGSSGKGATTKLIAKTLRKENYRVCHNISGSNLEWGVTTSIIASTSLRGRVKADYLVLECDERYVKKITTAICPKYLVVTNLTKDQPPRQHDIDEIYGEITKKLLLDTTIITNMDEPYLRRFSLEFKNKNVYFSLAKNKYSYKEQIFENLNTYYCPKCFHLLEYDYYNFETLGKYHCVNCNFKYQKPLVLGKNLDLENGKMTIEDDEVLIGGGFLYNAYNTLCAYTVLKVLNIPHDHIISSFNELNNVPPCSFENYHKTFYPFSCKAENATTYNQAIFKVIQDSNSKSIILGWQEISRRYKHFDVSWLYDIEFELLNDDSLVYIYCCGPNKEDLKRRLLIAGFDEEKIIVGNNPYTIKEAVMKDDSKSIYGILNFDYVELFDGAYKEDKC